MSAVLHSQLLQTAYMHCTQGTSKEDSPTGGRKEDRCVFIVVIMIPLHDSPFKVKEMESAIIQEQNHRIQLWKCGYCQRYKPQMIGEEKSYRQG